MKTYLFLIGGTGSRVLRSLTMLLASGVKVPEDSTIVPVIIDYDASNEDLRRTNELLARYRSLHNYGGYSNDTFDKGGFFRVPIGELQHRAQISFESERNTFSKLIGYPNLDSKSLETKLFIDSLYDTSSAGSGSEELNLALTVGFQGNPNIGSVVINDYFKSDQFSEVLDNFNENDRIFIVGSIFGGTGSSGLPQLVRKIRQSDSENLDKTCRTAPEPVRNAKVGAYIVMPYFGVKKKTGSTINSESFNSKAKAALSYYSSAGINDMIDEVYYVACGKTGAYDNNIGGKEQKNDAHFVELLSAMSIIEFMNHSGERGPKNHKFYTYTSMNGLTDNNDIKEESFQDLLARPSATSSVYTNYVKCLNEFALFSKFFNINTKVQAAKKGLFSSKEEYYKRLETVLKPGSDFEERIDEFINQEFIPWTDEMKRNVQMKFHAYDFDKDINKILKLDSSEDQRVKGLEDVMVRSIAEFIGQEKFDKADVAKQAKYFLRAAYMAGETAVQKYNIEG